VDLAVTEANLLGSPVVGDPKGTGGRRSSWGVSRGRGLPGGLHVSTPSAAAGLAGIGRRIRPRIALADLDGNERLEITSPVGTQLVHVVESDGFEAKGWPRGPQVKAGTRDAGRGRCRWRRVAGRCAGVAAAAVVRAGDTAGGRHPGLALGRFEIDLHPGKPADRPRHGSHRGATVAPPAAADPDRSDGDGVARRRGFDDPGPGVFRRRCLSMSQAHHAYAWELPVAFDPEAASWDSREAAARGRLFRPPPNRPPVLRIYRIRRSRAAGLDRCGWIVTPTIRTVNGTGSNGRPAARELSVVIDGQRVVQVSPLRAGVGRTGDGRVRGARPGGRRGGRGGDLRGGRLIGRPAEPDGIDTDEEVLVTANRHTTIRPRAVHCDSRA
jgi:hypothetical protein